jgi:hypothetical protein
MDIDEKITSDMKRKRDGKDIGHHPQIMLTIQLEKDSFDHNTWLEWIRALPKEAQNIHIDGKYDSISTLLILRMPVAIWNMLPSDPAYKFVGFVTSGNG